MIYPNSFSSLLEDASQFETIPFIEQLFIDTMTPIDIFHAFRNEAVYLLESKEEKSDWSRYSFIGLNPFLTIEENSSKFQVVEEKKTINESSSLKDVLSWMNHYLAVKKPKLGLPFEGGPVGYFSYDFIELIEANMKVKPMTEPDGKKCLLQVCETIICYDQVTKKLTFIHYKRFNNVKTVAEKENIYHKAKAEIKQLIDKLYSEPSIDKLFMPAKPYEKVDFTQVKSNYDKEKFLNDVEKVREYIRSGDTFQTVLSQRFELPINVTGFDLYRVLRTINPSPYLYYLKFDDMEIVGSSPERQILVQDGYLEIHPIAGTRRRGKTEEEDNYLAEELKADEKEVAEHYMLVDLARNDIGRVAQYGSVKTPVLLELSKFSHVMHLISKVTGELKKDVHPIEAMYSSFPAGTVSGAPKVRAMEIINELEPTPRGVYSGCIAYIDFDGNIDSCITIRTIIVQNEKAYIQAGAGIVADSVPELEWKETRNKASALIKTIQLTEELFKHKEEQANETIIG